MVTARNEPPQGANRGGQLVVLTVLAFQGLSLAINGVAAPWMMRSFGLDQAGIAGLFGWISVSAIGAFLLARQADRLGRRRVLVWAIAAESIAAVGAALSPTPLLFAMFDIVLQSAAGAAVACSVVWFSEQSGSRERARGQGLVGLALVLGSGPCIVLMPILARTVISWRALFLMAAAVAALMPWVLRLVKDAEQPTMRTTAAAPHGGSTFLVWPIIASTVLSTMATASVEPWRFFHMVNVAGLLPADASLLLIAAGVASLIGFPIGARASDRLGRVAAVAGFIVVMSTAITWTFWGPPRGASRPALWLGGGFALVALAGNAITVAANTALTELVPATERATIFGSLYLAGALGRVASQVIVALLAPLGVSTVVGGLATLGLPSAAVFGWSLRARGPIQRGEVAPVRVLSRAALLIVALIAGLATAEGIVRLVSPRALMIPWQDDIKGVTAPLPEVRGVFSIPDRFDTTVTIRDRFRSRHPIARTRAAGVTRIAVLGDSCTFGWGADDHETYPAMLEQRLSANPTDPGRAVEVLNAGVIGTGTGEQTLWYDLWVRQYDPSIVVLSVFWNDLDDDARGGFFERDAQGTVTPRPYDVLERALTSVRTIRAVAHATPGFDWLSQHSELLTWIRQAPTEALVSLRAREIGEPETGAATRPPSDERLAVTVGEIEWLRRRLRPGTRLAVVFIPSAESFDATRAGAARVVATSASIVAALSDRLPATGVPFRDLTPALARAGAGRLYFARDPHPAPAGYAAIADAVAAFLAERGVIDSR
jgi:MFS family permease/lysophospholipase L1-like esterase